MNTLLLALLLACNGTPDVDDTGTDDTGTEDTGAEDTGTDDETCEATTPSDPDATPTSGGACVVNADCPDDERCGCDEETGCFCETGERGDGCNGVDTCEDGDDCASSLCVEGAGGDFYCSDLCETDDDCGDALPNCMDIAFVGRICVRDAPTE